MSVKIYSNMEHLCMLVTVLLLTGGAAGHEVKPPTEGSLEDEWNNTDSRHDRRFFLKQIFNKYGDHGIITFEVRILSQLPNGLKRNWPSDLTN